MKQIAIMALLGILLLSGCINQSISNSPPTAQTTLSTATITNELKELELSIEGLWCESCVYGIQSIMNQTTGIQSAQIKITDYIAQTGIGRIVYDPTKISSRQIASLTVPYPSKIVKDNSINQ